jgi:N-acetylglucosamine malate deacetylase 1
MKLSLYARRLVAISKQLKLQGLITALSSGAEFSQLIKPLGQRPLILSAHPGNEVMALGGTMAWYAKLGHSITVLTITAGRHGTNTGARSESLGPKRKKEQLTAFKLYNELVKPLFWDRDENFEVDEEFIVALLEVIDDLNPDIIYVPSLLDSHPDNQSISLALAKVLQMLPSTRLKDLWIAQYELWTPLVPNKILNIDDYVETKTKAIECHESQLLCRDYLEAMRGLNRYRAAILGAGSTAEAYFICKAKQYREFVNPIAQKGKSG